MTNYRHNKTTTQKIIRAVIDNDSRVSEAIEDAEDWAADKLDSARGNLLLGALTLSILLFIWTVCFCG